MTDLAIRHCIKMVENISFVRSRRALNSEISDILSRFLAEKREKGVDLSSVANVRKRDPKSVRVKLSEEKEMALSLLLAGIPDEDDVEDSDKPSRKKHSKSSDASLKGSKHQPISEKSETPIKQGKLSQKVDTHDGKANKQKRIKDAKTAEEEPPVDNEKIGKKGNKYEGERDSRNNGHSSKNDTPQKLSEASPKKSKKQKLSVDE